MMVTKWRGKRTKRVKWIYGYLTVNAKNDPCIETMERPGELAKYEIFPDSAGMFTGMKDRDGTDIYYGDVVKYEPGSTLDGIYRIVWHENVACFAIQSLDAYLAFRKNMAAYCRIIGNYFDNPELLTVIILGHGI